MADPLLDSSYIASTHRVAGVRKLTDPAEAILLGLTVQCPACKAEPTESCVYRPGRLVITSGKAMVHTLRLFATEWWKNGGTHGQGQA